MKVCNLFEQQRSDSEYLPGQFARDLLQGLQSNPKNIPAKYFYDETGSILFQKISGHEDYYLTQTEYRILEDIKSVLADVIDTDEIDIIELGAGDGHKTQLIIDGFIERGKRVNFYPIDISEKAMDQLEKNIEKHTNLSVHGVIAEYFSGLRYVREHSNNRQLVLFLGSNIGNFNQLQSQRFLNQLRAILKPGDYALIGFDLKKDLDVLHTAYNDSAGYTEEFNLNLLRRINRELGGEFIIDQFQHYGTYNPVLGAMESYLLSKQNQVVYIKQLERSFDFNQYEPIHLEYSFKYLRQDIEHLCNQSGFDIAAHYNDPKERFIDSLWTISKN